MPDSDGNAYPEDLMELFLRLLDAIDRAEQPRRAEYTPQTVWDMLAAEGNLSLIERLKMVEQRYPGYGTMVVPEEGYSDDDDTHNAVIDWLRAHDVNVLNTRTTIARLEKACIWKRPDWGGVRAQEPLEA